MEDVKKQVEEQIKAIIDEGLQPGNVEYLYKLVDIHKDIANEKYWNDKEEMYMRRYRDGNYVEDYSEDNYGRRGRNRDGRRKYREGDNYGHYDDGDEMIENMREHYQGYRENMSYGAEGRGMKALNMMLESCYEFVTMLSEESQSQEEAELVKKWARKIGQI